MSDHPAQDDPSIDLPGQDVTPLQGEFVPPRERPPGELTPVLALAGCSFGGALGLLVTGVLTVALGLSATDGASLIFVALALQPPLLLGMMFVLLAGRVPLRVGLAWRRVPWLTLLLAPIGLLGASLVGDWLATTVWHATGQQSGALQMIAQALRSVPPGWRVAAVLGISLVPGLCEEAAFRGLLQGGLQRYGRLVALLVPALAFGLFHGDKVQGTGALVLGLFLGELRYRSGSIVPGVVAHAANNLVAGTAMLWASEAQVDTMKAAPPAAVAVGLLVAVVCLVGTRRSES